MLWSPFQLLVPGVLILSRMSLSSPSTTYLHQVLVPKCTPRAHGYILNEEYREDTLAWWGPHAGCWPGPALRTGPLPPLEPTLSKVKKRNLGLCRGLALLSMHGWKVELGDSMHIPLKHIYYVLKWNSIIGKGAPVFVKPMQQG